MFCHYSNCFMAMERFACKPICRAWRLRSGLKKACFSVGRSVLDYRIWSALPVNRHGARSGLNKNALFSRCKECFAEKPEQCIYFNAHLLSSAYNYGYLMFCGNGVWSVLHYKLFKISYPTCPAGQEPLSSFCTVYS